MNQAARMLMLAIWPALLGAAAGDAPRITLTMDDLEGPALAARGIRLDLAGADLDRLRLGIEELTLAGQTWRGVQLECGRFSIRPDTVECTEGELRAGIPMGVTFSYSGATGNFQAELRPGSGESWGVAGTATGGAWDVRITVANGNPGRLAGRIPAGVPQPRGGAVDARLTVSGQGDQWSKAEGDLRFRDLSFSDEPGLHAGEKVGGNLRLTATQSAGRGRWSAEAEWTGGDIFWQPVYVSGGGYRASGRGAFDAESVRVEAGAVSLGNIGTAEFDAELARTPWGLRRLALRSRNVELGPLFDVLGRPFLQQTALAEAEVVGQANIDLGYERGQLQSVLLEVTRAALRDTRERFVLGGIDARIPWSRHDPGQGEIRIGAGHLLRVPFGPAAVALRLKPNGFGATATRVPLLDGSLTVEEFDAEHEESGWRWSLTGGLSPVSMEDLSRALGIHVMHGSLSAVVPRVRYARSTLDMEGALLVNVFDGSVVITQLSMQDSLGRAPRLRAEVDMKGLDLDLLTRTFDFGSMQGRVDVTVRGLELSNWRPVALDARVASSPGDYPRKISQRAVQNIGALGGAGAAAAIQRSFIGMFEEFGYSRLGLSCRLEQGVCHMDGIADAPGGYVIVKGGGIPALTVMGYNRTVSWNELVARLQRITRENVKPVIQ